MRLRILLHLTAVIAPLLSACAADTPAINKPAPEAVATADRGPVDETTQVPFVSGNGQANFRRYLQARAPKSFVVSASGIVSWRAGASVAEARQGAIDSCTRASPLPCLPFAEDDRLVWAGPLTIDAQQSASATQAAAARLSGSAFAQESIDRSIAAITDAAAAPIVGATPTSLPGGKVITTVALRDALRRADPPTVIEVSSLTGPKIATIPGALWLDKAGLGRWQVADESSVHARLFRQAMTRLVPDTSRALVFACYSATCWQSYRAALRALAIGYTNVAWYRGGMQSWIVAGLPVAQSPLAAAVYDTEQELDIVLRQETELAALATPDRRLPRLDVRRWHAFLVAAHDREPVFHQGINRIASLLARMGVRREDTSWLSSATSDETRVPTRDNLGNLFAPRRIARNEGCFVYLTSHGDQNGIEVIAGRDKYSLAPAELGLLLDRSCGQAPTIVVVSACYSGVYVDPAVLGPNRILLTAARRDRASFGCSPDFEFTFYDACFIENFEGADSWADLARRLSTCVRTREAESRFEPRSLPTATIGATARNLTMMVPPRRAPTPRTRPPTP